MPACGWSSSRGETLEEILQQQGRFSAREAALIGVDVCEALAAVHGAGLLHRDVKAQNVMRDRNGRIVLMDFGTGRRASCPTRRRSPTSRARRSTWRRSSFAASAASVQSDVYSVGVLLYRLVTSSFPVVARSLAQVREGHARGARAAAARRAVGSAGARSSTSSSARCRPIRRAATRAPARSSWR